jgi:hypothetical protein
MAKEFSIQDGNLSNRPITVSIPHVNSDVDCSFEKKPSGDIYKKTEAAAVRQSVKNLLMTNYGSVPFRPLLGANLGDLLFNLSTNLESEDIRIAIRETLRDHEPRVRVKKVDVDIKDEYNSVSIQVTFEVISTSVTDSVNVNIARIR